MLITYVAKIRQPNDPKNYPLIRPDSSEIELRVNGVGKDENAARADARAQVRRYIRTLTYDLFFVKKSE
jgi:hypothetical protein